MSDWEGGATRQTTADDRSSKEPRLSLVIYHDAGTELVPLALHGALTVGRGDAADVMVPEDSLSRRHARFSWTDDGVWVVDLGSTNGTFVAGRRVTRALVAAGDEIQLGSLLVSLHAIDPNSPAQPVVSEDAFEAWLGEALARAKVEGRPLALFMVRELNRRQGHLGRWLPRLRAQLRGPEHLGIYGPGWLVIGAEATEHEAAERFANAIASAPSDGGPLLGCAFAIAPRDGASIDQLIGVVREGSDRASVKAPVQSARELAASQAAADGPLIASPSMRSLFETARRVAPSHVPVLIYGETGVGKELVARAIHASSERAGRPLVTINCGSLPPTLAESVLFGHERGAFTGADRRHLGAFEQASTGSLFLDEIGELPLNAQSALLRAIEEQRIVRVGGSHEIAIDVRIIAATNRDLEQRTEAGSFRKDLFFRLNTVTLRVPPLRDRPEEVELLAERFLRAAQPASGGRALAIGPSAREKLLAHAWPGNVRELRNAIERAVILANGSEISADDLPLHVPPRPPALTLPAPAIASPKLKDQVRAYEAELIIEALKQHDWNQTETARALHIPVRTLAHKIHLFGLKQRFPRG